MTVLLPERQLCHLNLFLNGFSEKLNDSIWGKKGRCSLETVHKLQDSVDGGVWSLTETGGKFYTSRTSAFNLVLYVN